MTTTNAFSILCVLIRAFALWLFVTTLIAIPGYVLKGAFDEHWILLLSTTFVVPVLIAFVMWVFAEHLARMALARPTQVVFGSEISAVQWQSIAFSVIGLLQLINGIGYLVYHAAKVIIAYYQTSETYPVATQLSSIFYAGMIDSAIRIIIGVSLLLGARGLVTLLHRLRG